jgi:hypothetical protein
LVALTGFEPVISSLRGTRPRPLDESAMPERCWRMGGEKQSTVIIITFFHNTVK